MKPFEAPQWKEAEAPAPPQFDVKRALAIEMPPYMSLKFGVDPRTITITSDGVVRYVAVAYREGTATVNAFYEGVRCSTEEYKTYARYTDSGWSAVATPEWKPVDYRNSNYTAELARQALCRGHAPRLSVEDMVRELKQPETLTY
ncbi:MAG: CNP1-like family protein [Xenophilus sp.]